MSDHRQVHWERVARGTAFAVRSLMMLAIAGLWTCSSASAQDKKDKDKPIEDKTIVSPADGWPLRLTYYKSTEGKEAAVVLLMHMKGESRLKWTAPNGFAKQLHDKGFAVLAVDLRKHGQSKPGAEEEDPKKPPAAATEKDKPKKPTAGGDLKPDDYRLMVRDMDGIKRFIYEEHQNKHLNMRKMAIVAPEMSAAIAITFAAADWQKAPWTDAQTPAASTPRGQDVQAMIFLSPETTLPGVAAHQIAPQFKAIDVPMASLIVVGKTDPKDKEQAKKLFQMLGGNPAKTAAAKKTETKKATKEKEKEKDVDKERLFFIELPAGLRGTELLGKKLPAEGALEGAMLGFLQDHLQTLKGPVYEWRDRKSKLE